MRDGNLPHRAVQARSFASRCVGRISERACLAISDQGSPCAAMRFGTSRIVKRSGSKPWPLSGDRGASRALAYLGVTQGTLGCDPRSAFWVQRLSEADAVLISTGSRPRIPDWVAVDDSDFEFPPGCANLLLCDSQLGFDAAAAKALKDKLAALLSSTAS